MNISNKEEFASEIEKYQLTNLFYMENCDTLYEYFVKLISSGMKDVSELKKEVNNYDIYIYFSYWIC